MDVSHRAMTTPASRERTRRAAPPQPHAPPIIEDTDVTYGPQTRAQASLPFSVWVRRRYKWWPGSERHRGLVDRIIIATLIAPGVVWACFSFGWIPAIFVVAEAVVIAEIVYRVATGTMLGD
jgi:hypothetical protein